MDRKLRIGVIGAGGILKPHSEGYRLAADKCEVVAVSKRNIDAESQAWINGLLGRETPVYADYRELLARGDIDAVDIITPHDLHMPMTIDAAAAGKHVLVEKVMARNIYECDRMIAACADAGVSLYVCHDRRYLAAWAAIKELIDSGALGEIFYAKLEHNQNVVLPEGHWIRSYDQLGGGALMSCLTHQIDALRWLCGEVKDIACMTKTLPGRMEGETAAVMTAAMASGALANLSINWFTTTNAAPGLFCELIHICGDRGEVYYTSEGGAYYKVYNPGEKVSGSYRFDIQPDDSGFMKITPRDNTGGIARCVAQWVDTLYGGGGGMLTPGGDSRRTVEVAEAAYRSFYTKRFVTLPIEAEPWRNTVCYRL